MAKTLYTIGYEGRTLDELIGLLRHHTVDCVIDVREIALSRKPGFSKSGLSARLRDEAIDYVHIRQLGSPKLVRERLKRDGDYSTFFLAFQQHLADSLEAIELAYGHVLRRHCCLLCFEKMASYCHRSCVAATLRQRDDGGLKVKHL